MSADKLTEKERGFISLISRSPDIGNGWRLVSGVLWPLAENFTRPELVELERHENGGCVRLTDAGKIVERYL